MLKDSLGNYERRVLLELDQCLTEEECASLNAIWDRVRSTIQVSYDLALCDGMCVTNVRLLLVPPPDRCISSNKM